LTKNKIKYPFNIAINGRFLSRPVTGVERYAIELVKAIDQLIENGEIRSDRYSFTLLAPKNIKDDLKFKNIRLKKVGILKGHLWEQLELPLYVRNGFLINLCNAGPALKKNQFVTIHDASVYGYPQAYSLFFRLWYKILFKLIGNFSRKIITVSAFSLNELVRYCKINREKISFIHEGKEHILSLVSDSALMARLEIGKRPYILAVSSLSPNKNFAAIIRAIEILGEADFDIVIAGGVNSRVFRRTNLKSSSFVRYTGYVTDAELKALYENAHCFIYPSFYEGFGLPPLEALACGCPVIVSGTASLPEVCKDAALYCDPHNPADLAEKITRLMKDDNLRNSMKLLGLKRAAELSWSKCAREMIGEIEKETAF
jgi:glycosyltransferase involved in cell wall biosynthesis